MDCSVLPLLPLPLPNTHIFTRVPVFPLHGGLHSIDAMLAAERTPVTSHGACQCWFVLRACYCWLLRSDGAYCD